MTQASDRAIDRMTVVAIAIVAYALANLIHEGLGHGGTCIAVGGRLTALDPRVERLAQNVRHRPGLPWL